MGCTMPMSSAWAMPATPHGWLVLLGGYGAGKTHLAAAIANQRVKLGHPVLFVVVPDLLDYLRATFSPSSDAGLDERMETIREIPLLILDDLGAHNSTPWAQEKLFQNPEPSLQQPAAHRRHDESTAGRTGPAHRLPLGRHRPQPAV